ncbi:hypothetical protein [Sporomusa sp.]|uniref:hypothetical protein n=1 Tax=Sporomusa sp. TaxID=2078658 RepID=UPI002B6A0730|nr:hypothetical protein [Sporomusa sp.]HWR45711.1 hypothetical protein [Sporomusa sp.]
MKQRLDDQAQSRDKKRISIRFCGGCNPQIDRGVIAGQLRASLTGRGYEVVFNQYDADVIIYLSGCTADCANRYSQDIGNTPCIIINGNNVNSTVVKDCELAAYAADKVLNYLSDD